MVKAITSATFGAWLIKCNPVSTFDLPTFIADGGTKIGSWSVRRGYRTELMAPGDKIIFWVSGPMKTRGIWGLGHVTDYAQDADPNDMDPGYWIDEAARRAVEQFVLVDIPLFRERLSEADLRAAEITDLEVQRMPQGSNPSWVSRGQLEALTPLIGPWPDEPETRVTVSTQGAGYGDAAHNTEVEAAAMSAVEAYYNGWDPDDVSPNKVGWDITFTHIGTGQVAKVEVKGVSGIRPCVLLTANELQAARQHPEWTLAVVTQALSDPHVVEYTASEVLASATPYVFRADFTPLAVSTRLGPTVTA